MILLKIEPKTLFTIVVKFRKNETDEMWNILEDGWDVFTLMCFRLYALVGAV